MSPILEISDLSVVYRTQGGDVLGLLVLRLLGALSVGDQTALRKAVAETLG